MTPVEASKKKNKNTVHLIYMVIWSNCHRNPVNTKERFSIKATHLIGLKKYSWSIKSIHKSNYLQDKGSQQRGDTGELLRT